MGLLDSSSSSCHPTLPLPMRPHCQRLFTCGKLALSSDLHCSNSSLKPQDSDRDATQYWEQARDCQELKAALADSCETRAENTALWWT